MSWFAVLLVVGICGCAIPGQSVVVSVEAEVLREELAEPAHIRLEYRLGTVQPRYPSYSIAQN
ncbi:MAG TPA: hypothetical protein VJB10_03260 [Candidatus Peribacteraceae bacterium]|nr:hypothetical protein [Candidatus Peribacteraceae bacterium]